MRNKLLVTLAFIGFALSANAGDLGDFSFSTDFVAPIVQSRANLNDAAAGTIVYDSTSNAFYGLPVSGDPTSASAWTQLSATAGTNNVVSGGSDRIERARITNNGTTCSISRQSGSWVSSVTRVSEGLCTLTLTSGVFTSAPTCIVTPETQSSNIQGDPTTTSFTVATFVSSSGLVSDQNFHVVCMGPR